jgi:hypothetical protein
MPAYLVEGSRSDAERTSVGLYAAVSSGAILVLPISCLFLSLPGVLLAFAQPPAVPYGLKLRGANKVKGRTTTSANRVSGVVELRAELARKIAADVRAPGEQTTAIPALTLYRLTAPTACYAAEYETGLAGHRRGRKARHTRKNYLPLRCIVISPDFR